MSIRDPLVTVNVHLVGTQPECSVVLLPATSTEPELGVLRLSNASVFCECRHLRAIRDTIDAFLATPAAARVGADEEHRRVAAAPGRPPCAPPDAGACGGSSPNVAVPTETTRPSLLPDPDADGEYCYPDGSRIFLLDSCDSWAVTWADGSFLRGDHDQVSTFRTALDAAKCLANGGEGPAR